MTDRQENRNIPVGIDKFRYIHWKQIDGQGDLMELQIKLGTEI
jgi:hypothetical protein